MAEAQSVLRNLFPEYGARGSLTDDSNETPRTALLEQYGSIVEPYEPSLSEKIYNFAFDALGGNTATGLDRQRIQRRARYPQMAIDQTGLAALTDYSQAMQDYARGDALSGTTNLAMAATSLIPGPQRQAVEEIADRLSKGTFGKTLKADDVFSLTDRNAAGMTPNMVDYQTAGILDRNPNYFRESKDVDYEIIRMSPDEYLERGAAILRPEGKTTQYVIDDRAKESGYIDNMAASMQGGQVYAAPYLDYGSGGRGASQEGMHRALAAKQLGMEEIPVMVMDSYKNPKSPYRSALNEMDTPAQGQSALNDLDMSYDARMQRATEQGYGDTLYHATSAENIDEFKPKPKYNDNLTFLALDPKFASDWIGKGGARSNKFDEPFYSMYKADREAIYNKYKDISGGLEMDEWPEDIYQSNLKESITNSNLWDASGTSVMPVRTTANNPFNPTKDESTLIELLEKLGKDPSGTTLSMGRTDLDVYKTGNYLLYETPEVVEFLKGKGFDSMLLAENGVTGGGITTLAVFDPKTIRSANAAFDPSKRSSGNIMAGIAGAGVVGGSALSGQQQDQRK